MSAYLLHKKYDITLFDKDNRLGGNAFTLKTHDNETFDISVFAFCKSSHPNFFKLLSELNIEYDAMNVRSLGVTYYDLKTSEVNLFSPFTLSLRQSIPSILHILKLKKKLKIGYKLLEEGQFDELTTEEALKLIPGFEDENFFKFRVVGIICLAASMEFDEVLKCPASFFFGKLKHHFQNMDFYVMKNKTDSYINAMTESINGDIRLNTSIKNIGRTGKSITVDLEDESLTFDKVVFSCPPDQVLNLLDSPTDEETDLLGAWTYKNGPVVIHQDHSSFPKHSQLRMYEYLYTKEKGCYKTSINSFYKFQKGVSKSCNYLGTQYPNFPIKKELIECKKIFRTPFYDKKSFATIDKLPSLNGKMNSFYCGSYFGFGLHEDAISSAVAVAQELGIKWD